MLEIKTILMSTNYTSQFDEEVNEFLADGWELVRRDVITQSSNNFEPKLYAELERMTEEEEGEEPEDDVAEWVVSRNPSAPYRCNKCGHSTATPAPRCPGCGRTMVSYRG